jgi:AAA domain
MAFSILDHLDQLEPSNEKGKFLCPACGGNDFTVNKNTGGYNCWHDPSPAHRADIRDALAPLTRWEKPPRSPGRYDFSYKDRGGFEIVVVHRDDTSGSKRIWQDFPTIEKSSSGHKAQLQEVKTKILPYKYHEAIAEHDKTGLPIFIVEGELTCESMWAIELPCVTFLGGSKQYRTNGDYSSLFKGRQLVLCPDRDEQGVAFMAEVANDNPGAQWLYADPRSWEWDNLPSGNGYDIGDYIEEGATKDDLLSSIVSKSRHKNTDGKPSYEEIISTIEGFVGLYANEARINYETNYWLEQRGVKMTQQNVEKIIDEARTRVHGKEEIESIDALTIASSDKARDWLIAGIVPLGSVTLLAAAGGTGKTTLLYNWALHVGLGTPWSGRRCMKGRCLLISADEPLTDTAEKLSVIGYQDAGLEPGDISFWETWRFAHMKQLEDYIRKERPSLVMIDSLTACLAGMNVDLAKSSAGDAIYGLRDMANTYRCSIVILHHLNKSGGLRDSTSFVDNVSEVVKLTRSESFDPNEFTLEWLKSRSGLTGKHVLKRDSLNYGWHYAGPLGGSLEELNQVVNVVNMRKTERFNKHQVASLCGSFDTSSTGKMLEVARRQGLITSSFVNGPNGEKTRAYHSWDYQEPDFSVEDAEEEDFF